MPHVGQKFVKGFKSTFKKKKESIPDEKLTVYVTRRLDGTLGFHIGAEDEESLATIVIGKGNKVKGLLNGDCVLAVDKRPVVGMRKAEVSALFEANKGAFELEIIRNPTGKNLNPTSNHCLSTENCSKAA